MLTLLLTRHGHTDQSEPDRYIGQHLAASLTDRGRRDVQALAERLAGVPIDRIVSSPLGRAVDTARILAAGRDAALETDARLAEMDYAAWEGQTVEQIARSLPDEFELYERNPATHHVGGGESGAEVAARVGSLIDDLLAWSDAATGDRTCLLVGHTSVNRALLAVVMGVPLADYRRRFEQDWANLTVLRWPDRSSGPLLLLANDLAHIRGLRGVTWG